MNLGLAVGFLAAFAACRRLVKGGVVWCGTPCSQWVWLSRGSTGRCRIRPRGDKRVRSVRSTNRLVRRLCFLWLGYNHPIVFSFTSNSWYDLLPNVNWHKSGECFGDSYLWLRLEYCRKKGIFWIIEQPASSLLPLYKPLEVSFVVATSFSCVWNLDVIALPPP